MDLKQLKYFVSIAQTLNFTQSAKDLYITQPAISRAITELERELGAKLFTRDSHRVALTQAGEAYYKHAVAILDEAVSGEEVVQTIAQGKQGVLRISSVPSLEKNLIDALAAFSSAYPDIRVELDSTTGTKQISAINKNAFDFYFSFRSLLDAHKALRYRVVDRDRYHLFVPDRYAGRVDPADFRTLSDLNLVVEKRAEGPFLVKAVLDICASRGLDVSSRMLIQNDIHCVLTAVNAGLGYTILPKSMKRCGVSDYLATFPIPGKDTAMEYAVGWDPANNNHAASLFLEVLDQLYPGPTY